LPALSRATAIFSCFALLVASSTHAQQTRPREHFQNADVVYDWVANSRGDKLRTFISHPRNASGKVPVRFFVGWLSCDSVESPEGETDGFSALVLPWIDQSGYCEQKNPESAKAREHPATKPTSKPSSKATMRRSGP
jgi:hypothetical protein